MEFYSFVLWTHIISGFTALLVGLIPMFSQKGGLLHVRSGKVYFWAMFGVFITSSIMFCIKPDRLLFLFLVGVFSFYQTFSGVRILKYKKPSIPIDTTDKIIAFLMGISGFAMICLGGHSLLTVGMGKGVVYLVFGCVLLSQGISDFFLYSKTWNSKLIQKPKLWMYRHISRMGGSYIATLTAFIVVNNTFLPPLIGWLGPGVIGSFIIALVLRKYKNVGKSVV